ncbi:MAG: hypothetical protein RIG82_13325 [Phycisphaeraceae bacterium]
MRISTSLLLTTLLLAVPACDPAGGADATSRNQLAAAIQLFEQANIGFIPQQDQRPGLSLKDYRIEKLTAARTELSELANSASDTTRARALRLLADIDAAQARLLSDQATTRFAEIAVQGVQAAGMVDIAEKAVLRIGILKDSQASTAESMANEAAELEQKARAASQEVEAHRRERDRLAAERERVRRVYEESVATQVELINRSGPAIGDEKYELLDQAARAEVRASLATSETEKFDSQIFAVETEMGRAQAMQAGYAETAKGLRERAAATQAADQSRAEAFVVAQRQAADAAERLLAAGASFAQAYDERVEPQLVNALESAEKAVANLNQARRLASRDEGQAIDIELLGKRAELAHAALIRANVLEDFGNLLRPVQESLTRLGNGDQAVSAAIAAAQEKLAETKESVAEAIQQALEQGDQLAQRYAEDTQEGRLVRRQIERLRTYAQNLGL